METCYLNGSKFWREITYSIFIFIFGRGQQGQQIAEKKKKKQGQQILIKPIQFFIMYTSQS